MNINKTISQEEIKRERHTFDVSELISRAFYALFDTHDYITTSIVRSSGTNCKVSIPPRYIGQYATIIIWKRTAEAKEE